MKIAIVHYHLGPGGVSQVIAAASRALTAHDIPHVVLVGTTPDELAEDLQFRLVSGLGYLADAGELTADTLLKRLRCAACEALGQAPDIWHFHNHSLGKNPLIAACVARLAEENEKIVLQIHDLAEEGRPENYQVIAGCPKVYPLAARVHYAFLNSRDLKVFTEAGLKQENASVLANPLALADGLPRNEIHTPILFAPVRGIRRKNLGELVLLSALVPAGARIAVSRAPLNPAALPVHDTWRKFANRQRLPIEFDVVDRFSPAAGADSGFESWIAHSTHFVSTSVAEGFGLPFLEAAAHGKPLVGRNLAHLTAEHARHGIHAGDLYDQLLVPAEWIDRVILREHLTTTLERNFRAYRRLLSKEIVSATFESLLHEGWLDFGNLPEPLQQGVIERLADPACHGVPKVRIGSDERVAREWLADALANRAPAVSHAQLAPYSPADYGGKIAALYAELTKQPASPVSFLSGETILIAHLAPQSFHFLLSALKPNGAPNRRYHAVIFDIYGTLLIAPAGGVKPDPAADGVLRTILREFGHTPPESPSRMLHDAVLRHHAAAGVPFPEVDLRELWREVLGLDQDADLGPLVEQTEAAWHPAKPMPGAAKMIQQLSRAGISLGLLSNAQCNTLKSLGSAVDLFAPALTVLSYRHGIAKPSPELFEILIDRLAGRGLTPAETLLIGNDPIQDIAPAAAHGFQTALFIGHPESHRSGDCSPDLVIRNWADLGSKMHSE